MHSKVALSPTTEQWERFPTSLEADLGTVEFTVAGVGNIARATYRVFGYEPELIRLGSELDKSDGRKASCGKLRTDYAASVG